MTAEATPGGSEDESSDRDYPAGDGGDPPEPGNGDGWRPKGIPAGVWQKMKDGGVVKGVRP